MELLLRHAAPDTKKPALGGPLCAELVAVLYSSAAVDMTPIPVSAS